MAYMILALSVVALPQHPTVRVELSQEPDQQWFTVIRKIGKVQTILHEGSDYYQAQSAYADEIAKQLEWH